MMIHRGTPYIAYVLSLTNYASVTMPLRWGRKTPLRLIAGGWALTALYEPTGHSRTGVKSSSVANTRARSMNDSVNVRVTS